MKKSTLLAVVGSLCLILGLIVTSVPASDNKGPGYSIFDETIADMTWPEVEKAAKDGAIILLPTGVIEQHGPHLPLAVDTYGAYIRSKLTKQNLEEKGIKALITPPFYWGINNASGAFPGSFTTRKETTKAVIYDMLANIKGWGFNYVFVLNHHGDTYHEIAILEAVKQARIDFGIRAYYILPKSSAQRFNLAGRDETGAFPYQILITPSPPPGPPPAFYDIHAGKGETGMMMHYFPQLVNTELAKTLKPNYPTFEDTLTFRKGWSDSRKLTPLGYMGDPASFDPGASKKNYEAAAKTMADVIESFLKGTYVPPLP